MELVPARAAEATNRRADPSTSLWRLRRAELLVVIGLTAVSAVTNLVDLGSRSLWNDEIHSALIAAHHGTSLWSAVTADGGNMMLYYLLLHVFVALFGDGQLVLRIPSAAAGIVLTPVVFLFSRRMFGSRTGAISAAIVAVSPALVVWDQQARGYSLGTLMIALSLLSLLRALERPSRRRWCVYGLIVVLSIYTLAYAALFLVAQWLALALWPQARRQARSLLNVVAIAALAYALLIVLMLRSGAASVLSANPPPSTSEGIHFLEEFSSALAPDFFALTLASGIVTVMGLLCFVVAGVELLSRMRRSPREFETACLATAMSWLFVPLLLDSVFSLVYRSIFNSSFLLQSVPAGAVVVAFVFGKLLPRCLSVAFAIMLVGLLLAALVPTYGVSYEQWAQASHYIRGASRPGDCLTVNKSELASNLAYYFSLGGGASAVPQLVLPAITWKEALDPTFGESATTESYASLVPHCKRLWIVLSRVSPGQFLLVNGEISWFHQHGFTRARVSHFTPRLGFGINVALLARRVSYRPST